MEKNKLVRITTIPISLEKLLENQLGFMSYFYNVTAISSDKRKLDEFGKMQKVNTFSVEMTRKITPLKDLRALLILMFFFKRHKPFIVHSHTPKAGILGMMAAKFAGVPHRLHTVAGLPLLESKGAKRILLNFVEKITYKFATKIFPNSKGLYEIIINEKLCNENKMKFLVNGSSNGINTSFFDIANITIEKKTYLKKELGITENDFVFIFVGRIVNDKGIGELIRAFKKVNYKYANTKLILVGPTEPELDPLHRLIIEEININPSIIEIGYKNDVRPYFAISSILVFPSYREGFPNVVMQAGAMGLPSIVTNINGCNEIIINEENGLIISVKKTEELFEAMCKVIEEEDLMKRMKKKSRAMIVERYEQQIVWEAILNEYKLLENGV